MALFRWRSFVSLSLLIFLPLSLFAQDSRAQAILRALDTHHEAALQGPAGPTHDPPLADGHSPWPHAEQLFAAAVGWLLNGRAASIPVSDTSAKLRAQLNQLHAAGIVERNRGAYRASHVALYSSYRLPAPPIPALTNEWDDPTDIDRESR